jgi:glycosyl transferase family 87
MYNELLFSSLRHRRNIPTPINPTILVTQRHRLFKLVFVPLLVFSLFGQCAVVWTQLDDIQAGYFDFVLYYSAAKIINDGNGAELFDLEVQRKYQKSFGGDDRDWDLPFNHPPYELLPLLPLVEYPFPVAHALWTALSVFLLAIALVRLFSFMETTHRSLFILMVLAFFPTITALKMGQDSLITTLLLVETFVSLKYNRYAIAGGLLALGFYKPQFVLPLFGILLIHRRWASVLGFMSVGLLLGALSLAMVGRDGLMGLVTLWLPMINRGHVVWPELMMNLRGLIYIVLHPAGLTEATNVLTLGFSVATYAAMLQLWPRSEEEKDELFDLRFAAAVIMTTLVSFHSYSYDGTMLVIPLVIMLNQVLKAPQPYSVRHRTFLAILISWFVPLLPNVLLSAALLAWWALPLPLLFAVIAIEIRRRSAERCSVIKTEDSILVACKF